MSDIKERLRENGNMAVTRYMTDLLREAADHIEQQEALIAELRKDADLWRTLLSACDFGELGVYRHIITDSWGSQREEQIDDTEIESEIAKLVKIHKEIKRIRAERKQADTSMQEAE